MESANGDRSSEENHVIGRPMNYVNGTNACHVECAQENQGPTSRRLELQARDDCRYLIEESSVLIYSSCFGLIQIPPNMTCDRDALSINVRYNAERYM